MSEANPFLGDLLRPGNLWVMLVDPTVGEPDPFWSSVEDVPEPQDVGYTPGGQALPNVRLSADGRYIEADPVTWPEASIAARYAVVYRRALGALEGWIDFGRVVRSDFGPFTVTWPGGRVLRVG